MYFCYSIVDFSQEPEPECASGQYRLAGEQTGVSIPFIFGYLEICVNGTYYSVCTNDSYSKVDLNATASFVCGQLGYNIFSKISTEYANIYYTFITKL